MFGHHFMQALQCSLPTSRVQGMLQEASLFFGQPFMSEVL